MSREKGRTRQGKQKKTFFFKKNRDTNKSAPPSPSSRRTEKRILQARKVKMEKQQDAGVVVKPFSAVKNKNKNKEKVYIRHDLDTPFQGGGGDAKPAFSLTTNSSQEKKPGFMARLSAMSPVKLVSLKKATPRHRRRQASLSSAALVQVAPPKTPPVHYASSIVKLYDEDEDNKKGLSSSATTTTKKKPSWLPPTTPTTSTSFAAMPSVMTASPIVATWTQPRRLSTARSTVMMTPVSRFVHFQLPALFAKEATLLFLDDEDETTPGVATTTMTTMTPGRPF